MSDADVLADADQRDPARRHAQLTELRQDLNELQLVVQIGFEPQHVLTVAEVLQQPVTGRELGQRADVTGTHSAQEVGTNPAQLDIGHRRNRPLMQDVAPRHHLAPHRLAQCGDRHVAIGDVKHTTTPMPATTTTTADGQDTAAGNCVRLAGLEHSPTHTTLEISLSGHLRLQQPTAHPPAITAATSDEHDTGREECLPLPPFDSPAGESDRRFGGDGRRTSILVQPSRSTFPQSLSILGVRIRAGSMAVRPGRSPGLDPTRAPCSVWRNGTQALNAKARTGSLRPRSWSTRGSTPSSSRRTDR